jgi:hypothetical protein
MCAHAAGFALGLSLAVSAVHAGEAAADAPSAVAVTVYRAPARGAGSFDLDSLQGFALVSETRTVHLPAGLTRLRFEGVADGIEAVSAIVTGLPSGVIEKNRDARLLSPAALLEATLGKALTLSRSNRRTGKTEEVPGTLLADADGVVFKSAQGVEALRCSGLPETFAFEPVSGLSARPTLSVLVHSDRPLTRSVTLSYLARGFDWGANYTAVLSVDGRTLDLGAWVTLANGNGTGFPQAHTQVVAGRVNRERSEVTPIELGAPILATCWPRGTTSDVGMPPVYQPAPPRARGMLLMEARMAAPAPMALQAMAVAKTQTVMQEQLGDLKLYRVPERTTLASRQSKQVRLLDRSGVPVTALYGLEVGLSNAGSGWVPAHRLLRTDNTAANHLGLPLPSGSVAVFGVHGGERLLEHEVPLRDLALDEEVELDLGPQPEVQVRATVEQQRIDATAVEHLPQVPGVVLRTGKIGSIMRLEVSNARAVESPLELKLTLPQGAEIVRADHLVGRKNGRPVFRLKVPANATTTLRLQVQSPA